MQSIGLGIPEEEGFLLMGLLPARLTSGQERQGFRMELLTYACVKDICLVREATAGPSDQVINTWWSLATSSFSFLSTVAMTHVWVLCLFSSCWLSVPSFLHCLSESLLPSGNPWFFSRRQSSSRILFIPLACAIAKLLNIVFFEF